MFQCSNSGEACLTNPSGLMSFGYLFFHWGATYSFEPGGPGPTGGYFAPTVGDLTTFAVLITYVFPLVVACIGLLAPKIVRLSKITRIGFVAFGAFVFAMSVLLVLSMIPTLLLLGIVLMTTSGAMLAYGRRPGIFAL